jgi:multiple sugar transport system substrate-binding protein
MQANRPTADGVDIWKVFRWAPYPAMNEDSAAHVTTGGLSIAVSAYSESPDLAFEAALCMRNHDSQHIAAVRGGFSPVEEDFYLHPDAEFAEKFPFHEAVYEQLKRATNRPKTPAYQSVSIVVAQAISPPDRIDPVRTLQSLRRHITDALASRGLIP